MPMKHLNQKVNPAKISKETKLNLWQGACLSYQLEDNIHTNSCLKLYFSNKNIIVTIQLYTIKLALSVFKDPDSKSYNNLHKVSSTDQQTKSFQHIHSQNRPSNHPQSTHEFKTALLNDIHHLYPLTLLGILCVHVSNLCLFTTADNSCF